MRQSGGIFFAVAPTGRDLHLWPQTFGSLDCQTFSFVEVGVAGATVRKPTVRSAREEQIALLFGQNVQIWDFRFHSLDILACQISIEWKLFRQEVDGRYQTVRRTGKSASYSMHYRRILQSCSRYPGLALDG